MSKRKIIISAAIDAAIFTIACFAWYGVGWYDGKDAMKTEAIKRGYAKFVTNEEGMPVWQWKEKDE